MSRAFSLTRRNTIAGLSAMTLAGRVSADVKQSNNVFVYGVASGDPDTTSIVLWTHVTANSPVDVMCEVSRDARFRSLTWSGQFTTGPERDHTVKIIADGLKPGGRYFYRFRALGETSPIGRTCTLPVGHLNRLGIALVSCSNFAFGYFNAYDAIAKDTAVDFVLHTGDYIYEYGADSWGGEISRKIGRIHQPAHEIISLPDYRTRHAQYKTDAGSQAMNAAKPLLACWDDHESANNPWVAGAQNHQPDTEGNWAARRAASVQAYYEWMPVREPVAGRTYLQFWRNYAFGDLATLSTLETRHTARALQVDYRPYYTSITSYADAETMEREAIGAPNRSLISTELEADLSAAWTQSKVLGQPWRLIGNPMPIARTRVPDVVALGVIPNPASQEKPLDAARELAWKGKWNLPFYPDTWDGYEWARERFYTQAKSAGADDLIFLTGDSHSFWANTLFDANGQASGIELGTAGVSSPGDFIDSGFDPATAGKLDAALAAHNPEILWTDNLHQGYVRLELTRSIGRATFVAVDNILSAQYHPFNVSQWQISKGKGGLDLMRIS